MKSLILFVLLGLVAHNATASETIATSAVREVLAVQREAWNRGDIDGFMQGYLRSDDIRFASGVWLTTRDHTSAAEARGGP